MYLLAVLVGVFLLFVLGKIFSVSMQILLKLIWNGIAGAVLLFVIDLFAPLLGFHIEISVVNALIAGFFGIPGVIVLALLAWMGV